MRLDLPIIFLAENGTKLCAPAALLYIQDYQRKTKKTLSDDW